MKRQLPSWMLPKVGAITTPTSNSDGVENNCPLEEASSPKATDLTANSGSAVKKKAGRGSKRKSHSIAKIQVKKESKSSGDDDITQRDKKKIDSSKGRVQRASLKKSHIVENPKRGSCDVKSGQGFSDDDMELTIEDMMTIAKEYVKDYENKEQRRATTCSHTESVKQFPMKSESGISLDSHCEGKRSSTLGREDHDSSLNKTAEWVPTRTSQTGDPAQDMLDLFLGPWLKKPIEEEKKKSIVEGMEFTHQFTRTSDEEFSREETVPMMKKKSSLRDKVAMLLH